MSDKYGSIDPEADAQIRELLNTISNLQFELTNVTNEMGRALIARWREIYPGAGWPDVDAAKSLLEAALVSKANLNQ
jgi:hypothetical protein